MLNKSISDQVFVARETQVTLFRESMMRWLLSLPQYENDTTNLDYTISSTLFEGLFVAVHGHSGFGKSTLLKHFHSLASETSYQLQMIPIIDWHATYFTQNAHLSSESEHLFVVLEYFETLYKNFRRYLSQNQQIDFTNYTKARQDLGRFKDFVKELVSRKRQQSSLFPVPQELHYAGDYQQLSISLPSLTTQLQTFQILQAYASTGAASFIGDLYFELQNRWGVDLDRYLQPTRLLGQALGKDLCQLSEHRPYIMFFDSYEHIDAGDAYLREVMVAAGSRVGWVLAGRKNIWSSSPALLQRTQQIYPAYKDFVQPELALSISLTTTDGGALTSKDIITYFDGLHQYYPALPVPSEEVAMRICRATQGIPLAVSIVASFSMRKPDLQTLIGSTDDMAEITEQLVQRYLSHAPLQMEDRKKLYALALVRRTEDAMAAMNALGFLSGQEDAYEAELDRLHRFYGFVFTEQGFPTLHQEVRYWLRLWLLRPRQTLLLRPIVQHLKDEYQRRIEALEQQSRFRSLHSRFEDDEWVAAYLDLTEICFWSSPVDGVLYALLFAIAAAVYRVSDLAILEQIVRPFVQNIPQPYIAWWESALACLYPSSHEEGNRWQRSYALKQLAALVAESRLHCASVLALYSPEMEALIQWSIGECYREDEPKTASFWYQKAWKHLQDDSLVQERLLDFYLESAYHYHCEQRYAESIELLQHALQVNSMAADVYYSLGNSFYAQRNYTQAVQEYQRAIYCDPEHFYAFINLGNTQNHLKNYAQAIAEYHEAGELGPEEAILYYNKANAHVELRDYKQALQDYGQALSLDPELAQAYGNRGNVHALLGNVVQARADYNKANELLPDDSNIAWMAVWANLDRSRIDVHVTDQLIRIAALQPAHYIAHVCQGVVCGFQQGDLEKARLEMQQALLQRPEEWDPYFWQGMIFAYLKDFPGAQDSLEKAVALGLPPLLLLPLYWLEEDCPEFFVFYAKPLLEKWHL